MSTFRQPPPQPDPWYDRAADWLFERWGVVLVIALLALVLFWGFVGYIALHFLRRYW